MSAMYLGEYPSAWKIMMGEAEELTLEPTNFFVYETRNGVTYIIGRKETVPEVIYDIYGEEFDRDGWRNIYDDDYNLIGRADYNGSDLNNVKYLEMTKLKTPAPRDWFDPEFRSLETLKLNSVDEIPYLHYFLSHPTDYVKKLRTLELNSCTKIYDGNIYLGESMIDVLHLPSCTTLDNRAGEGYVCWGIRKIDLPAFQNNVDRGLLWSLADFGFEEVWLKGITTEEAMEAEWLGLDDGCKLHLKDGDVVVRHDNEERERCIIDIPILAMFNNRRLEWVTEELVNEEQDFSIHPVYCSTRQILRCRPGDMELGPTYYFEVSGITKNGEFEFINAAESSYLGMLEHFPEEDARGFAEEWYSGLPEMYLVKSNGHYFARMVSTKDSTFLIKKSEVDEIWPFIYQSIYTNANYVIENFSSDQFQTVRMHGREYYKFQDIKLYDRNAEIVCSMVDGHLFDNINKRHFSIDLPFCKNAVEVRTCLNNVFFSGLDVEIPELDFLRIDELQSYSEEELVNFVDIGSVGVVDFEVNDESDIYSALDSDDLITFNIPLLFYTTNFNQDFYDKFVKYLDVRTDGTYVYLHIESDYNVNVFDYTFMYVMQYALQTGMLQSINEGNLIPIFDSTDFPVAYAYANDKVKIESVDSTSLGML